MIWTIYALKNQADEIFYIGVSSDLKRRMEEHRAKFGAVITVKELETKHDHEEPWRKMERRWIKKMRDAGHPLINVSSGGSGCEKHSEATKEQLRILSTGRPGSEKQKAYMRAIPREVRSLQSKKVNSNWWANATPEQRDQRNRNMHSARGTEKVSASMRAKALRELEAHPERREQFGARVKSFWANMTPEYRAEFMKRRGEKIAAAKAAKKK